MVVTSFESFPNWQFLVPPRRTSWQTCLLNVKTCLLKECLEPAMPTRSVTCRSAGQRLVRGSFGLRLTRLLVCFQGICQAASYIYKKLVNDGILNQAFSIVPVSGCNWHHKVLAVSLIIDEFHCDHQLQHKHAVKQKKLVRNINILQEMGDISGWSPFMQPICCTHSNIQSYSIILSMGILFESYLLIFIILFFFF